jgi:hypothetical protein
MSFSYFLSPPLAHIHAQARKAMNKNNNNNNNKRDDGLKWQNENKKRWSLGRAQGLVGEEFTGGSAVCAALALRYCSCVFFLLGVYVRVVCSHLLRLGKHAKEMDTCLFHCCY